LKSLPEALATSPAPSAIEQAMTTQSDRFDLPRDGVGWVFVIPEAVIPPRTTLYTRESRQCSQTDRTKGQPGDGNHHGYRATA
jgi:hypothetical protein